MLPRFWKCLSSSASCLPKPNRSQVSMCKFPLHTITYFSPPAHPIYNIILETWNIIWLAQGLANYAYIKLKSSGKHTTLAYCMLPRWLVYCNVIRKDCEVWHVCCCYSWFCYLRAQRANIWLRWKAGQTNTKCISANGISEIFFLIVIYFPHLPLCVHIKGSKWYKKNWSWPGAMGWRIGWWVYAHPFRWTDICSIISDQGNRLLQTKWTKFHVLSSWFLYSSQEWYCV